MQLTLSFFLAVAHCETRGEADPDHCRTWDGSFGRYGIRQIYLDDANEWLRQHGRQTYTLREMADPRKAEIVMQAYMDRWVPRAERIEGRSLEEWEVALIHHHGGPNGWKRGKTDHYAVEFNKFKAKGGGK